MSLLATQRQTFGLCHRMVQVALGDLEHADAVRQPRDGAGSSIAYLVGHLITGRHTVLECAGDDAAKSEGESWRERFGGQVGASDGADYPDVRELAAAWDAVGPRLDAMLADLDEETLLGPPGREGFPLPEDNLRGLVTFMAFHESYHVGQIGLLRTHFGYPSIVERFFELARAGS